MELALRPASDLSVSQVLLLWADPDVVRTTGIGLPLAPPEAEERLRALVNAPNGEVFALFCGEVFLGLAGCLCVSEAPSAFGLFYQIVKSAWGQGVGTAAAAKVLAHMKERHSGARILADVLAANPASERILLRLGFSLLGESAEPHLGEQSALRHYALQL